MNSEFKGKIYSQNYVQKFSNRVEFTLRQAALIATSRRSIPLAPYYVGSSKLYYHYQVQSGRKTRVKAERKKVNGKVGKKMNMG